MTATHQGGLAIVVIATDPGSFGEFVGPALNIGVSALLALWFSYRNAKSEEECKENLKEVNQSIQTKLSTKLEENTAAIAKNAVTSDRTNTVLEKLERHLGAKPS